MRGMAVTGDRPCFSSSPVGAARSQEVLVGVKLHHVDRPRVARELGHHLASSQIPELGGARRRSGPGWVPRLPLSLYSGLSSSSTRPPPSLRDRLGTCNLSQEGAEDAAQV